MTAELLKGDDQELQEKLAFGRAGWQLHGGAARGMKPNAEDILPWETGQRLRE